jgi:signal transduction histidine kinase
VNDILDAASLKENTLVVTYGHVNMRECVEDVVELTLPILKKGVKLQAYCASNVPQIEGDAGRVIQVGLTAL